MIKTTSLAFAAACLMTVSALPAAHAQMAGEPPAGDQWATDRPGGCVDFLVGAAKCDRQPTL